MSEQEHKSINGHTLTREFCKGKELAFYPKTVAEAVFIQRQLFAMGFGWDVMTAPCKVQFVDECISEGMGFSGGRLHWGAKKKDLFCSADQFEAPFDENDPVNLYVPAEQAALLGAFNKLCAKVDALTEEVATLRKELEPRELDKRPRFLPPKPGTQK